MLKVFYILVPFGTSCELQMCSGRKFEGVIGVYIFSGQLAFFRRRWLFAMRKLGHRILRGKTCKNVLFFPRCVQSSVEEEDSSAETPAKELQKVVGDVGFSVDRYHGYFYIRYCSVVIPSRPSKRPLHSPTPWIF